MTSITLGPVFDVTSRSLLTLDAAVRFFDPPGFPVTPVGLEYIVEGSSGSVTQTRYKWARVKNSINTSGAFVAGSNTGVILWNPYTKTETSSRREPTLRRYNPPKFSKRKPLFRSPEEPIRRKGQDDAKYQSALSNYEALRDSVFNRYLARLRNFESKYARYLARKASYDASYSRSVSRYKLKLNKYLKGLYTFYGMGSKRLQGFKRYQDGTEYSLLEIKGPVSLVNREFQSFNSGGEETRYSWVDYLPSTPFPAAYGTSSLITSTSGISSQFDSVLKRRALLRLGSGSVEGGVLLFESRETASLLLQVFKFLAHLRSNPVGSLSNPPTLKDLNNLYLAYHFGVSPLIDDLRKLVSLLNSDQDIAGDVRVKCHLTVSLDRELIPLDTGGFIVVSGQCDITRTYKFSVQNPFYRVLASLGLINPFAIAWELIPLSFVFDWFYNIGDYLNAQTATSGLQQLEAWETLDIKGLGTMGDVGGVRLFDTAAFDPGPVNSLVSSTQRALSFSTVPIRLKVRHRISSDLDPDIPQIKLGDWPLSKLITSLSLIFQRIL